MSTMAAVSTVEKNITDSVLNKVKALEQMGQIKFPKDYSVENALKSAYFILLETKDKNGALALDSCTQKSIANTLFEMVTLGLNPVKKQCYFIVYGKELKMQVSYMGKIALAKRYGGVKNVIANVIYQGDEFEFEIDVETGLKKIIKHKQSLENINVSKITGAYAILTFNDDSKYIEIMNFAQIEAAWNKSKSTGKQVHKDFGEEMAKKTVINRACKLFFNTSDDGAITELYDDESDTRTSFGTNKENVKAEISENANSQIIDFDDLPQPDDAASTEEPNSSSTGSSEEIDPGF